MSSTKNKKVAPAKKTGTTKRVRKPLTPEQRERKNRRARELYAERMADKVIKAKIAKKGKSTNTAKTVKKPVVKSPVANQSKKPCSCQCQGKNADKHPVIQQGRPHSRCSYSRKYVTMATGIPAIVEEFISETIMPLAAKEVKEGQKAISASPKTAKVLAKAKKAIKVLPPVKADKPTNAKPKKAKKR